MRATSDRNSINKERGKGKKSKTIGCREDRGRSRWRSRRQCIPVWGSNSSCTKKWRVNLLCWDSNMWINMPEGFGSFVGGNYLPGLKAGLKRIAHHQFHIYSTYDDPSFLCSFIPPPTSKEVTTFTVSTLSRVTTLHSKQWYWVGEICQQDNIVWSCVRQVRHKWTNKINKPVVIVGQLQKY